MLALHLAQEFTLRAFLGELGDKTFLLTGILVAWCPWDGVRSNEKARYQQLLVFLAAVLALYVRTLLISAKTVKPSSETSNCVFEWMTFAFILILIPKACAELRRTDAENAMRERLNERAEARAGRGSQLSPKMGGGFFMGASGAPFARADTEEAAEEQHQHTSPRPALPGDYGSTGSPKNCSAAFPANFRDTVASNIIAFFCTVGSHLLCGGRGQVRSRSYGRRRAKEQKRCYGGDAWYTTGIVARSFYRLRHGAAGVRQPIELCSSVGPVDTMSRFVEPSINAHRCGSCSDADRCCASTPLTNCPW